MSDSVHTEICRHDSDAIYIREKSLVDELIGQVSFSALTYYVITGQPAGDRETKVMDAVLVTLMEHGLTPSAIAARMVYSSSPESVQAGVSAGLLAVGTVFVGTMEGCAALIDEVLAADDAQTAARDIARRHREARRPLPGFGHPFHKPDDPRTPKLFSVAREAGVSGKHIAALQILSTEIDAIYDRHLTINATGAIAALLGEIAMPSQIARGIAVISRAAGLVAHIAEEQRNPAMMTMWESVEASVPYKESTL